MMPRRHATVGLLAVLLLGGAAGWSLATPPEAAAAPQARRSRPRVQTAPTRDRIIEIQEALVREGAYSGKPTGRWDAATVTAMKRFQAANRLTQTGKVGALSLQRLGFGSEVAGRSAPLPQGAAASALRESLLLEPDPEEPEEAEGLAGTPEP